MRRILLILLVVIMMPLVYLRFFYPPNVLERETKNAIAQFSIGVMSQDRAVVQESLQNLLSDDAKVQLEVSVLQVLNEQGGPVTTQDFDKTSFVTFVDNILYTLTDYNYESWVDRFKLSEDYKTAQFDYSSQAAASGGAYYAGTKIPMRFTADISCGGQVSYDTGNPQITSMHCSVKFRSLPQTSATGKSRPREKVQMLR